MEVIVNPIFCDEISDVIKTLKFLQCRYVTLVFPKMAAPCIFINKSNTHSPIINS